MRAILINLLVIITIFNFSTFAQTKLVSNSFYFGTILNIEKFAGKEFRYTLDLKSTNTDSLKGIAIQARQVINKDEWLGELNSKKDLAEDTLWHQIKISDKINLKAKELWLYATFLGNGKFFADNLKVEVKTEGDTWLASPLKTEILKGI